MMASVTTCALSVGGGLKMEPVICRCGGVMVESGYAFNAVNYPRFVCGECGNEAVAYLPFCADKIRAVVKGILGEVDR